MTKKEKTVMRLYGIDKDEFLVKVARAYMAYLEMQGKTYSVQIAFTRQKKRDERIRARVKLNSFDIVVIRAVIAMPEELFQPYIPITRHVFSS